MSDVESPVVAAKTPARVEVEAGKQYMWCRCGRSENQPFCDGSHQGTGLGPVAFTPEKSGTVFLCRCKATGTQPFCDGTHSKLDTCEVGDPVPN